MINFLGGENRALYHCCDVFADVNATYFTLFRWIVNIFISFQTLKHNFWKYAF